MKIEELLEKTKVEHCLWEIDGYEFNIKTLPITRIICDNRGNVESIEVARADGRSYDKHSFKGDEDRIAYSETEAQEKVKTIKLEMARRHLSEIKNMGISKAQIKEMLNEKED